MLFPMKALAAFAFAVVLTVAAGGQETGILRVTVVLVDADGNATPVPRVLLLVSDNPATAEPRRVRTGADGAIELKLRPGNYTVETDQPVSLGGQAYAWIQMVDVAAGRDAVLALTSKNAEIAAVTPGVSGAAAPVSVDSAAIFNKWRHSVVELWTPTAHATGFLIDSRGLIATNDRALGEATTVEVQLSGVKVHGRVVATDRLQGVSIIWIDPASIGSVQPVPLGCDAVSHAAVEYNDKVVAMIAPLLESKDALPGTVSRVTSQSFQVDWRLTPDVAGGPVFTADGAAIGIAVADPPADRPEQRRSDSYVIPIGNTCAVLAAAEKKLAGAAPPPGTPLRMDAVAPPRTSRKPRDPNARHMQIATISASDFDISLLTPEMGRREQSSSLRGDFGNWTDYVAKAPPQLLVRATPQFEESFWKTLARGAAQTQGMALPPMKSFNANFLRMRAFCGAAEVAPIHPLIIERQVTGGARIREGLYVFALTDFGPHCGTVRFELHSEKSGQKGDSRTIDPDLFTLIAKES
jgi:S1-C subfamily serine protease